MNPWVRIGLFSGALLGLMSCDPHKTPSLTVEDWRHGPEFCPVHHRKMESILVRGLAGPGPDFVKEYVDARKREFPNGGIDYGPGDYGQRQGLIYACSECERARERWERTH